MCVVRPRPQVGALQRDHRLRQNRRRSGAFGRESLRKLSEGKILVNERCESGRANLAQKLPSARIAAELGAENDGVGQPTDEPLGPGTMRLATFVATRKSSCPK